MDLFTKQKQTHRHRELTCGSQVEVGLTRSLGLGGADYYI